MDHDPRDFNNVHFLEGESLKAAVMRADNLIQPAVKTISKADFIKDFKPPDYLVDGMIQKGFFYALTAPPGAGKTALALLLAMTVGSCEARPAFAGHAVEPGNCLYMGAENPDDLRMRIIGMDGQSRSPPGRSFVRFQIVRLPIDDNMLQGLADDTPPYGYALVVVDTSPAYFMGEDENSNTAAGDHARALRRLTKLPGNPTVLALCHPTKGAASPQDLIPRGGGAFNGELDGNLTLWKAEGESTATLHHLKIRGIGFEPIPFKIETITTPNLVDSKGRLIPTVAIRAINDEEAAADHAHSMASADAVLIQYNNNPHITQPECAEKLGWVNSDGRPSKQRVWRALRTLAKKKLVAIVDKDISITKDGKKYAGEITPLSELR